MNFAASHSGYDGAVPHLLRYFRRAETDEYFDLSR
jgi:hypothetical protein